MATYQPSRAIRWMGAILLLWGFVCGPVARAQNDADIQAFQLQLQLARTFAGGARLGFEDGDFSSGLVGSTAGMYENALKAAEKAVGPDHLACSDVCSELASFYVKAGLYAKAEPLLVRALKIRQPQIAADHIALSDNWNDLGVIYSAKRDYTRAEGYFLHALKIREAKKDNPLIAETLQDLGILYERQGLYAKAEPFFARSVSVRETIGKKDVAFASALNRWGKVNKHLGQYAKAAEIYERAIPMLEELKGRDSAKTALVIYNLAEAKLHLGEYELAEKLAKESYTTRKAKLGEKSVEAADSLHVLGEIYQRMNRYPDAIAAYQESIKITEAALGSDSTTLAVTLNNLAAAYVDLAEYAEAEKLYLRSLKISEAKLGADHPDVAQVLNNLGHLETNRSRFSVAEDYYRRAWGIQEKKLGPNHPVLAETLINLGVLYAMLGQFDKAEPLYQRALKIQVATFTVKHPKVAITLNNLATLYVATKQTKAAGDYYHRSLEIREALLGKDHGDVAIALANLGAFYNDDGQFTVAEPLLKRSLEISEKLFGPDHPRSALTVNNLGLTNVQLGRTAEAEKLYARSLKMLESASNPDAVMAASNLAAVYSQGDRWAEAASATEKASRALRKHVTSVLPILAEQEQLKFLHYKQKTAFESALSIGLARKDDEPINALSAGWLINGKAVAHEALAERALLGRESGDPALAPLVNELSSLRKKMAELALNPQGEAAAVQRQIAELGQREQNLARTLAEKAGRGSSAAWVELQDVRKGIPKDAVFIDIARFEVNNLKAKGDDRRWLPAHYAAWIVPAADAGALRVIDLGEADAIEAAVKAARDALVKSLTEIKGQGEVDAELKVKAALEPLAKLVLHPLLPHIGEQSRWIFSPDSALWLVPWAALPLPDGSYPIEKHPLSYVVSGRDLVTPPTKANTTAPIIFADPAYDLGPAKAGGTAGATPASRSVAGSFALPKVAPLPATAVEARMIQPKLESYAGAGVTIVEAANAQEGAVKAVHRPRVMVLSTHGFFLDDQATSHSLGASSGGNQTLITKEGKRIENPLLRCGLLFAGCNDRSGANAEDGVLTGLEIVGTDLKGTELVVLSACETGLGEVRNGEGVAGLRQAFQLAGADAVIASLWQVPDRETAKLMSGFFGGVSDGLPKAEALRQAQLKLIGERREKQGAAHPFYWAAFTLTGHADFLPVEISPKTLSAEELVERALQREKAKQLDQAVADLTEAIKLAPEMANAYFHRGRLHYLADRNEQAIADFTETVRIQPGAAAAWALRSDLHRMLKQYDKALEDGDKAVQANGQLPLAYGVRAAAQLAKKDTEKAIADFTKAVELDPKYRFGWDGRGDAYEMRKEYAKAAEDFTKALEISQNATTFNKRGLAFAELKEFDKAIADQTEALRLNPNYAYAAVSRGLAWEKKGDADKALADLTEAIRISPKYAFAYARRGLIYHDQKKYDQAINEFTESLKIVPDSYVQLGNRGFAYEKGGKFDQALADYSEAIRLNEKNAWALNRRAGMYATRGEWDKSLADLTRARELDPTETTYWTRLALVQLKSGDLTAHKQTCQAMLEKFAETTNVGDMNSVAWSCALVPGAVSNIEPAQRMSAKAAESKPTRFIYLGTYALTLYRAGKFEEALKTLNESITLEGKGGVEEDQIIRAMCLQQLGKSDEARESLAKVSKWLQEQLPVKAAAGEVSWNRRIELELLQKEAEGVVK